MAAPKIRILLVSRETRLASKIDGILQSQPNFEVTLVTSPARARRQLAYGDYNCLMLNLDEFGARQFGLVEQIRKLGHVFPIMILAEKVSEGAALAVESTHNVIVLSRPLMDMEKDLLGLASRLLKKTEKPFKRATKRHSVLQKGLIENTRTGNRFTCVAQNLSKGGVLIEFGAGSVRPNDYINVTIILPNIKKSHVLPGRVIWVSTSSLGAKTAGVRFIAKES